MWIVLEGGEGVGKSTQIKMLAERLCGLGRQVCSTREPGGTPLAEQMRAVFKSATESVTPLCELHLVCAARSQHITHVIQPALASGTVVLCDRFLDSTYVYQSILGGVGKDYIDQVTEPLLGSLLPTWTFVLSLDPSVAWERMQATRAKNQDRYDTSLHHPTIQEGFLRIVQEDWPYPGGQRPKRIAIDASRSPEVIHEEIWDQVFGV